ncbi:DUF3300 domain-containing protein [Rheinheimera marina]|uniref:DUF3300 domain-containing protein n=1 Tax=Rheinheimera marina TaxID=1774958 RepID=A0ABV9JQQ4_9GAMM
MKPLISYLSVGALLLSPAVLLNPAMAQQTVSAGTVVQEFNQGQLDAMLAPIALYPDTVLSHVLIASTYPLEVIKAHRWAEEHPNLKGEDAVNAVENQDWDPSVKALVAFPELLQRMSDDIDWTQRLGDAFLAQEGQVMASIQTLRSKAYESGQLAKQQQVKVIREEKTIIIEPASPSVVYVPYYDPWTVYGPWWWRSYDPFCFERPRGYVVSTGFYWGVGIRIAPGFYFSTFHWPRRQIVVIDRHSHWNSPRYYSSHQIVRHKNSQHWRHDPHHRQGVSYHAGYQPTREFNGNRSYKDQQQHRDWANRTREERGIEHKEQRVAQKDQRFDDKQRQFERSKTGDALVQRSKTEPERQRVSPNERRVDNEAQRREALRQDRPQLDSNRLQNREYSPQRTAPDQAQVREQLRQSPTTDRSWSQPQRSQESTRVMAERSEPSFKRVERPDRVYQPQPNMQREAAVPRYQPEQRQSRSESAPSRSFERQATPRYEAPKMQSAPRERAQPNRELASRDLN